MNKFKFKPGCYYRYGDLGKFGFVAIVVCDRRVDHRDGWTTLNFRITDLKINEFNIGCREFLSWMKSSNRIDIYRPEFDGYEEINTWYFTMSAENVVDNYLLPESKCLLVNDKTEI